MAVSFIKDLDSALDYAGEIASNTDVYVKYSPHNIRRIIFSPDGLIITTFTALDSPKGWKRVSKNFYLKRFEAGAFGYRQYINECYQSGKTNPLVHILTGRHIYNDIEEIIFLGCSSDGAVRLEPFEYDLSSLAKNKNGASPEDAVKDRFNRLRYVLFIPDISLSMFISQLSRGAFNNGLSIIDNLPSLKGYNPIMLHESDWFEKYNKNTSLYSLDNRLVEMFEYIKAKYETDKKEDDIKEKTKERLGSALDEYKDLVKIAKAQGKLLGYLRKAEYVELADTSVLGRIKPIQIGVVKANNDTVSTSPKFVSFVKEEGSDTQIVKNNIKRLKEFITSNYSIVCSLINKSLTNDLDKKIASEYGIFKDLGFKKVAEKDESIYKLSFGEAFCKSAEDYLNKMYIIRKEA